MAIRSDSTHKQVDATSLLYHLLIVGALGQQVGSVAVENMDILLLNVDVIEEVRPHKAVVALGMVHIQPHVLIHVERNNVLETNNTPFIQFNQMLVEA